MHIEITADHITVLLPVSPPLTQVDRNELIKPSPTPTESSRPLHRRTSRPFVDPVFLTTFLQMRISLSNLLSSTPSLGYILGSYGAANSKLIIFNEILSFSVVEEALVFVCKKG